MRRLFWLLTLVLVPATAGAQLRPGAFTTLQTTDTTSSATANSVLVGCALGSTTCTGGIKGGTLRLSAGIAISGGTATTAGIVIPSAVPGDTTMALYNNGGNLTWNGSVLAAGSSVSGTTGKIGKFTASNAIGDSIITESGATISVAGTVNASTAYQLGGFSINTSGILTNVAYLDTANTFTAAGGQKFTGGISIGGGTQSTAGIMIPSGVPAVTTTNLHNDSGTLTWIGGISLQGTLTLNTGVTDGGATMFGSAWTATHYGGDVNAPTLTVNKSRGNLGAADVVVSGDTLYTLTVTGYDGSAFQSAASIAAFVDGTPGANDMPGRLTFSTTPDGMNALVERMRINNAGNVGIGTVTISARFHVISTTEQLRIGYDASNYTSFTVGSTGALTVDATGAGAAVTFADAATFTPVATFTAGLKERGRSVLAGEWANQAYSAGDYTASASTWTVDSGDVALNRYMLVGKTVTWQVTIASTDVGGAPAHLRIAVPGGLTEAAAMSRGGSCGLTTDAGTSANQSSYWIMDASGYVKLFLFTGGAWTTTAGDNTGMTCTITFEIS